MRFGWLMAATAALWAMPAEAANLSKFYLTGAITEQTSNGDPQTFGVGSTITLEGMADITDPTHTTIWGDTGYRFVGFYGNPTFKITIGGKEIHYTDEIMDNLPLYHGESWGNPNVDIGAPAVFIKDGKIAGVIGYFAPAGNIPGLMGGSSGSGVRCLCNFPSPEIYSDFSFGLSDAFLIPAMNPYDNAYHGPAFNGVWNFEQSIAPVPEPTTWALMILGVGLAGAAMRRRQAPSYARSTTRALAA